MNKEIPSDEQILRKVTVIDSIRTQEVDILKATGKLIESQVQGARAHLDLERVTIEFLDLGTNTAMKMVIECAIDGKHTAPRCVWDALKNDGYRMLCDRP